MKARRLVLWSVPVLCIGAALLGCAALLPAFDNQLPKEAQTILQASPTLELLSLEPHDDRRVEDGFHGWTVLGSVTLQAPAERKALVDALQRGIKASDGLVAACFIPRHGIRAIHDGRTLDLVICFECLQIEVYLDGQKSSVLTTAAPQPTFDRLLRQANVPLAPKPGQSGK